MDVNGVAGYPATKLCNFNVAPTISPTNGSVVVVFTIGVLPLNIYFAPVPFTTVLVGNPLPCGILL